MGEQVGLLVFLVTIPLVTLVDPQSKMYPAVSQTVSSVAKCYMAYLIFGWLDVPFGLAPIVLVGVLVTLFNGLRLYQFMQAYGARMACLGMSAEMDGDTLAAAVEQDDQARSLHRDIGHEIAYTVGGIVGIAIAGWWLLTW